MLMRKKFPSDVVELPLSVVEQHLTVRKRRCYWYSPSMNRVYITLNWKSAALGLLHCFHVVFFWVIAVLLYTPYLIFKFLHDVYNTHVICRIYKQNSETLMYNDGVVLLTMGGIEDDILIFNGDFKDKIQEHLKNVKH